jgi:hypothetical protein
VTFDSPATLPSVDRALCSLTGPSSSRHIAALCTRPAQHSTPSSADSTLRHSTDGNFALGPASLSYQVSQTIMAYLPTLYHYEY